jgi:formylglycine-generating enzyme required for sulfatase activity
MGIERAGGDGAYTYRVRGGNRANKPVAFVSWLDAARYANWFQHGKPSGPGAVASTETGAYDLTGLDAGTSASRLLSAGWALPTEDEWYKAAYYDPASEQYWRFPTRFDTDPVPVAADALGEVTNAGENRANYDSHVGAVTAVAGAGAPSRSAYGTSDQGGNVAEWLDVVSEGGLRVVRGGGFADPSLLLSTGADQPGPTERLALLRDPAAETVDVGFRLVRIPEPQGASMALACAAALGALSRWRLRARPSSRSCTDEAQR